MKKITALLSALAFTGVSVSPSFAASRAENLSRLALNCEQIQIIYNEDVIDCGDIPPINVDGRVMIPFRTALEGMGAEVDYNDGERLVTAVKGDTIIKFTLMDDTVYVSDNGTDSTVTMDTPMMVVDGRTLVPIRFMSDAFGMQIGWDGESRSVVIFDREDYFKDFETVAPNLSKLMSLPAYTYNTGGVIMNLDMADYSYSIAAELIADSIYADDVQGIDIVLNVKDSDIINDSLSANLIITGEKLYIKADSSALNALKAMGLTPDSETWYSVDIDKLTDSPITGSAKAVIDMLKFSGGNDYFLSSALGALENTIPDKGDVSYEDMYALANLYDTFELIDDFIEISETEDGGYKVAMNISAKDMSEIIGLTYLDCSVNISVESNENTSIGTEEYKISDTETSLTFTMNTKFENAETVTAPQIPQDAADITDTLLNTILNIQNV